MHAAVSLVEFRNLAVALGIGLLIGLERGWQQREVDSGERVAGLRTFAVIGLAGGVIGLLSTKTHFIVLGLGVIAMAAFLIVAHTLSAQHEQRYGITTELAAFTTFGLAALATVGAPYMGAVGSIIMATLLGMKPELHRWLERLNRDELLAGLKLLLISVVVLPLLPDYGVGPWHALNPYRIWLLVVIVALISFAGHFAVRVLGQNRGILLTGIFGGLASSTALTMHFARLSRRTKGLDGVLATGIVVALAISIPRIIIITLFVSPSLASKASIPLGIMTVCGLAIALVVRWLSKSGDVRVPKRLGPPFQLSETIRFALLVVFIMLASAAAERLFGTWSVYGIAIAAGAGNLTAATLSIAGLAEITLTHETAIRALVLAATAGILCKGIIAYSIGGPRLGKIVLASSFIVGVAGILIIFLTPILAAPVPLPGT